MAVTIVTFDGSASLGPTLREIAEWENPDPTLTPAQRYAGGGFPANVASRLVTADPVNWKWLPIDYRPGFRFGLDVPQKNGSIGRALQMLWSSIPKIEGKFVLCGLSQGAWICDLAFDDMRHPMGMWHSRFSDLIGVVTFGSPRRPQGHTIDLPGVIQPLGQGVAQFPHEVSWGTVPGIVQDPPDYMWSFCIRDDAASDGILSGQVFNTYAAIVNFLWEGDFDAILGLGAQILSQIVASGLSLQQQNLVNNAIRQWIPFTTGMSNPNADPRTGNPHAQYNSIPYDGLANNTTGGSTGVGKTATDLAVEWLLQLGQQYASVPTTVAEPKLGYTWWQSPPD